MQRQLGTLRQHLFVCEKVNDARNGTEHMHFHLFSHAKNAGGIRFLHCAIETICLLSKVILIRWICSCAVFIFLSVLYFLHVNVSNSFLFSQTEHPTSWFDFLAQDTCTWHGVMKQHTVLLLKAQISPV